MIKSIAMCSNTPSSGSFSPGPIRIGACFFSKLCYNVHSYSEDSGGIGRPILNHATEEFS